MIRTLSLAILICVAALVALYARPSRAIAQPAAPGAGHGYLIDKHLAAGLNCASCHKETPPAKAPAMTTCMSCHGSYPQIAAKTAGDDPNPHASHQGELPCETCHHVHQASVSFCDQCHAFGMTVP